MGIAELKVVERQVEGDEANKCAIVAGQMIEIGEKLIDERVQVAWRW